MEFKSGDLVSLKKEVREKLAKKEGKLSGEWFLLSSVVFIVEKCNARGLVLNNSDYYYDNYDFKQALPVEIAKWRIKNEI